MIPGKVAPEYEYLVLAEARDVGGRLSQIVFHAFFAQK